MVKVRELMETAMGQQAADLHLQTGRPPMMRLAQGLCPLPGPPLSEGDLRQVLQAVGWSGGDQGDGAFSWHDALRCRLHVCREYAGLHVTIRFLYPLASLPPDGDGPLLQRLSRLTSGLVLVCGPTGSGKTTTLYAAIHEIQDDSVSIATLEDPVEILMEGISQSQVQAKGGMMFQDGLRALLRQDPDILVVGEIRDGETARIAVRAALTGHVIFSTLHAPSAVEAVIRLTDMGVAPYLAADALAGVVSQRLVRCRRSDGSYQGRFCLCEVVPAGRRLRDAIRRCAGVRDLTDAARSDGAVLLPDVIARTLAAGRTDEREIRRVCEGGSSW